MILEEIQGIKRNQRSCTVFHFIIVYLLAGCTYNDDDPSVWRCGHGLTHMACVTS